MAGNWKMHKNRDETLAFAYTVSNQLPSKDEVESIVFAPSLLLRCLVKRQGNDLRVGAQHMHYLESGAYTGEISPQMVKGVGAEYVLIGHSERRRYFGETDEDVNKKVFAALECGLIPVICCGETEEQFLHHDTDFILKSQILLADKNINKEDICQIILAYEPIWAVGTGKTASATVANEKCKLIRSVIEEYYGINAANKIRILYGGSVTEDVICELVDQEHIDGALVGKASLNPHTFIKMANLLKK